MHERRCFAGEFGIGVLAESCRLRSCRRRREQADVANHHTVDDARRNLEEIFQRQVIDRLFCDHWARRARSSASSSRTRAIAAFNRSGRSDTYSAIAARATSCIERPSSSALRRSASVSLSVSRRFMAMTLWYRTGTVWFVMSASSARASRSAVVATLRAAGCVFAEDEAGLLIAAAPTAADLERLVEQR